MIKRFFIWIRRIAIDTLVNRLGPIILGTAIVGVAELVRRKLGFGIVIPDPAATADLPGWAIPLAAVVVGGAWKLYGKEALKGWHKDPGLRVLVVLAPAIGFTAGFPAGAAIMGVLLVCFFAGMSWLTLTGQDAPEVSFWIMYEGWMQGVTLTYPLILIGHGMNGGYYFGFVCWIGALAAISIGCLPFWLFRAKLLKPQTVA